MMLKILCWSICAAIKPDRSCRIDRVFELKGAMLFNILDTVMPLVPDRHRGDPAHAGIDLMSALLTSLPTR